MKKLGIILDSFSGKTQKEINKLGFEMTPQSIIVDGKAYLEGVDLTVANLKEVMAGAKDIKSSMPAIGIVSDKMAEMSKEYENVLYIPMNKGMSSTYSTGVAASSEYDNVHVIDQKLITDGIVELAKYAVKLSEDGKDIKEIISTIERISTEAVGYIVVKDTTNLIKSGRLGPKTGLVFEKMKLMPRLAVTEDGLKLSTTKRNFTKMVKATAEKVVDKIGGKSKIKDFHFAIASTGSTETDKMVSGALHLEGVMEMKAGLVAPATLGYTRTGAFGIIAWPKK